MARPRAVLGTTVRGRLLSGSAAGISGSPIIERRHAAFGLDAECGCELADLVLTIAGRQMSVMKLDHFGVAVSEVLSDDQQAHAGHYRMRGPGMPCDVEVGRRADIGPDRSVFDGLDLVRLLPGLAAFF